MRGLGIAGLIGLAVGGLASLGFTEPHAVLLGLVAFLVALWTNEALPLGVVSILPVILFPIFGILPVNDVTANYSKSIIFLFLGGFFMAIAMEKTELHRYVSAKLLSFFPHTPKGIIYALAMTSALLSSILSNTTVTLLLMPVALFLTQNRTLKVRFLLATAYGASIGGILTPIGTPPNLILLGFLEDHGLSIPTFGGWIVMMLPIAAVMLGVMPLLLSRGLAYESLEGKLQEVPPLTVPQKRLLGLVILLAVVLVANTFVKQFFGVALNEKIVLLGFGVLMFVPKFGFLTWEDTRNLPYEIIFLFGAGFSIAAAFGKTGLASEIAHKLAFIADMPFVGTIVIVAAFVTFATEVTSNTALISIALPVFYTFAQNLPPSEGMVLLTTATVAASYAFMLPIATPPNAIVMSSRLIRIKQMASIGFWLNLLGIFVLSVAAYVYWRIRL